MSIPDPLPEPIESTKLGLKDRYVLFMPPFKLARDFVDHEVIHMWRVYFQAATSSVSLQPIVYPVCGDFVGWLLEYRSIHTNGSRQ